MNGLRTRAELGDDRQEACGKSNSVQRSIEAAGNFPGKKRTARSTPPSPLAGTSSLKTVGKSRPVVVFQEFKVKLAFHGSALRSSLAWQVRHSIVARPQTGSVTIRVGRAQLHRSCGRAFSMVRRKSWNTWYDRLSDLIGKKEAAIVGTGLGKRNADHLLCAALHLNGSDGSKRPRQRRQSRSEAQISYGLRIRYALPEVSPRPW